MAEPAREFNPPSEPERIQIPPIETANTFPELIANSPLENTSLVYSVPVMGEWKNGNLQRMLSSMFSQRPKPGEAFEVEVISNLGENIERLAVRDRTTWELIKDEKDRVILHTDPQNDYQEKALSLLQETNEANSYLKQIIEAQRLARIVKSQPNDTTSQQHLSDLIGSVTDPLQKQILHNAIDKADSISLAVIDASHSVLEDTEYRRYSLGSLRTLGADVARMRFEAHPEVVLALYDADTVPESNHAVKEVQQIFNQYPEMNYLFTGMTNLPPGHTEGFIGDAPRENVKRTWIYNYDSTHGSPQIAFRLRAYDKLKELAGWTLTGFQGDEDRDTAYRLIYHFGNLQDGLLLESSADLYAPTAMTADRLDGSVDSAGRRYDYAENGIRYLRNDLGKVFSLREQLDNLIDNLPSGKQTGVLQSLEKARETFTKKEKVQQRFNHLVLNTLLNAVDNGLISHTDGQLQINDTHLASLPGGKALLHYARANRELITSILSSPDDIAVMKYYLGRTETTPKNPLSPFQRAVREYVGDVEQFDDLLKSNVVKGEKLDKDSRTIWTADDTRDNGSKISVMHAAIAEILALAHVNRTTFETAEFLSSRDDTDSKFSFVIHQWPKNPDEQDLPMNFGDPTDRQQKIKQILDVRGTEIPDIPEMPQNGWLSQVQFRSVPIFELFKSLSRKTK